MLAIGMSEVIDELPDELLDTNGVPWPTEVTDDELASFGNEAVSAYAMVIIVFPHVSNWRRLVQQ
jgi:hypothetical protein